MKKPGSEQLIDKNFRNIELSSRKVRSFVGFFYNSKFGNNLKFYSKEFRNYRITIVFLVWLKSQLNDQSTSSNLNKSRVKSVAVKKRVII